MSSTTLLNEYISLMKEVDPNIDQQQSQSQAQTAITKSDTLIIVDMQYDFLPGGAFGVAEGDSAIDGIVRLIHSFASKGATVIATRDYHPVDHCSFNSHGGPFPPHCIQGTKGSFLHEKIGDALSTYVNRGDENVKIVFKAFSSGIDSFGAFEYDAEYAKNRVSSSSCSSGKTQHNNNNNSHCSVDWTGGYYLFSSNQKNDINSPPDVMSVLNKKPLKDLLSASSSSRQGQVYVCGLALDFCVIDTAVNYANYLMKKKQNDNDGGQQQPIWILSNESRAAHIPGFGKFGSGFLTDPKEMVEKMQKNGIAFKKSSSFA